jgi:hypothetical protein
MIPVYRCGISGPILFSMSSTRYLSSYSFNVVAITDKFPSLGNPSPQPPAAVPTVWFELISAAVQAADVLSPPQTRHCLVCLEDLSPAKFPSRRISSGCNHSPSCCLSCLRRSIKSDHENKFWNAISCPECSSSMNHQDVRAFADPETFEQ